MLERGLSNEFKNIGKCTSLLKRLGVVLLLLTIIIGILMFAISRCGKHDTEQYFDDIERQYFSIFNRIFPNQEGYKFHSLELYCLESDESPDIIQYFVHAKYLAYIELDKEWVEIEEIYYGDNGRLESFYCLSWDSIDGFEEIHERFNRAVKEGQKKTYSLQKIQELINQNRFND